MTSETREAIVALRKNSKIAYVASLDDEDYPVIKAMLVLEQEGLAAIYFSTNTSSRRVAQFRRNPKASVYFCDEKRLRGVLLTGTMKVLTDIESKTRMWREGFEMYYRQGIGDPDYCILEFSAVRGNHYCGLSNENFLPGDI